MDAIEEKFFLNLASKRSYANSIFCLLKTWARRIAIFCPILIMISLLFNVAGSLMKATRLSKPSISPSIFVKSEANSATPKILWKSDAPTYEFTISSIFIVLVALPTVAWALAEEVVSNYSSTQKASCGRWKEPRIFLERILSSNTREKAFFAEVTASL